MQKLFVERASDRDIRVSPRVSHGTGPFPADDAVKVQETRFLEYELIHYKLITICTRER